jgi:hypothetical protein
MLITRVCALSVNFAVSARVLYWHTDKAELEDVVIVREPADLVPEIPDFVRAYLESEWNP